MGKLYLVPTPIGNLKDMTLRAIEILKSVGLILAEDTRTSSFLLKHFEIENRLMAHHKFNEHKTLQMLVARLEAGEEMALITDAGTPAISDPGFLLVRACIEAGIETECLPGPTALIPALVNSGLPSDRFVFEGFLPPKKGRKTRLTELASEPRTLIFYESPFRLVRTLEELALCFGPARKASVSRELTKMHEETCRGTLQELAELFGGRSQIKGEIVLVVEGSVPTSRQTRDASHPSAPGEDDTE